MPTVLHLCISFLGILNVLDCLPARGQVIEGAHDAQAEQLTEMWTMAMQLGPEGKEAALQAALTFISRAAPPIATVFTGICLT